MVPAFFSQENADAWMSDRQALEEVEAAAPTSLIPELRTMLGAFLFRGDDVFKTRFGPERRGEEPPGAAAPAPSAR